MADIQLARMTDVQGKADTTYVDTELAKKVDKVSGKQLSTNDYTTTEKNKLAGIADNANNYVHPGSGTNPHGTTKTDIGLGNVDNTSDTNKPISTATQTALEGKADTTYVDTELAKKVDKVSGKQLSTNDYTTTEKNKLAGIADNANNYVHPGSGTNPHGTTKTDIGLGNVDNTSDTNKPISTATQTALDGKANTGHKHVVADITDFPSIPTKTSDITNDSGFITNSYDNAISGLTATTIQGAIDELKSLFDSLNSDG
jgi:uncharacterized membrane protein